MARVILLLRGINVGGRNKLPMATLREHLEQLGGSEVTTYVQSGNAVLNLSTSQAKTIDATLSQAIARDQGFEPRVLCLTAAELLAAIEQNPFPQADDAPTTVHVSFLEREPAAGAEAELNALRAASERFTLQGRVFYLHAPDGIGRSRLASRAESAFGCPATSRNWRTVRALEALLPAG